MTTSSGSSGGVVVTGSTGIAEHVARRLAAQQRPVFVIGKDPASCAQLVSGLGSAGAGWCAADLRSEPETESAFAQAEQALGRIEGVVAVAGGSGRPFGDGWLHEMSLAAWEATLSLNLTTTFLTAREAVRAMRAGGGSLVLTSSVLVSAPEPDSFATHGYAAAKAAISGWVTSLASAYARNGIRVNAVAPGLVRTPMSERAAAAPDVVAFAERKQPLAGGLLAASDVADVMCAVLDAPAVTGQVLAVDAGWGVTSTS